MAEQLASEAVQMAERLGDPGLTAGALLRWGSCLLTDSPSRAREIMTRAFQLFESIGDIRGQANCQNSIAIATQFEGRVPPARRPLTVGISMAKDARDADIRRM